MPKAAYPVGTDIQNLYIGTGLLPDPVSGAFVNIDFDQAAADAQSAIEETCNRTFLATTQTLTFDAPQNPRGMMDLGIDFATVTQVTLQGTVLVLNQDYYLHPQNAPTKGKPYTIVEFNFPYLFTTVQRKSITVTGLVGYGAQIPDAVWDVMLKDGAIRVYPQIALNISKGLMERRAGDELQLFGRGVGTGPLGEEKSAWQATVDAIKTSSFTRWY